MSDAIEVGAVDRAIPPTWSAPLAIAARIIQRIYSAVRRWAMSSS